MGRYSGTLHNLADSGPSKHGNWSQLLNYLEGHSVANSNAKNPKYETPLPPFTSPTKELLEEMMHLQGPRNEDSPLRIAVRAAPSSVIAGLCHLGPEATRIADSRGRLPLHWACKRPPSQETERILMILVATHPAGLIHRDDGGRTPLHWLFWFHAESRSLRLVEFFCQPLDPKAFVGLKQPPSDKTLPEIPTPDLKQQIPPSAAIVHDAKHGALPIHYAAACGASKDVIKSLVVLYPRSKFMPDRMGRTPLVWFLGAGELAAEPTHVCGESLDPNATPIYDRKLSSSTMTILLTPKVARAADSSGSYPLHWACRLLARHFYSANAENNQCLSLKAIKMLLDTHVEALVSKDTTGKTPLHAMFQTVSEQQERDWTRLTQNKVYRDDVEMIRGGGQGGFSPPTSLVEMLLNSPDTDEEMPHVEKTPCAAHVEDEQGWLPLHYALLSASSGEVIQTLIQSHPTSLIHSTDQQLTPLHVALMHPYSTPLHPVSTIMLLLQAYVTSRHGTYVNGRLALKMEDSQGNYPLHYACRNQASLEVLRALLEKYPRASIIQNEDGDLPLHLLMAKSLFGEQDFDRVLKVGGSLVMPKSWLSKTEETFRSNQLGVMQKKMALMLDPLLQDGAKSLKLASSSHLMLPLQIAVAFDAVPYKTLYKVIDGFPEATKHVATPDGQTFTTLGFHDIRRATEDDEKWHMVRELLFCFNPLDTGHWKNEDLLERCCRIIREEAENRLGSHRSTLAEMTEEDAKPQLEMDLEMTSFATQSFDIPKVSGARPQRPNSRTPKSAENKKQFFSSDIKKKKSLTPTFIKTSIYDEESDVHLYVPSPSATYDEDDGDSDYFSQDGEEEEYKSDDSPYDEDFDEDSENGYEGEGIERTYQEPKEETSDSDVEEVAESKSDSNEEPMTHPLFESKTVDPNEPLELSDVAMRLWTFFAVYSNPESGDDSYAEQVRTILYELDFVIVEKLVNLPLPEYAAEYLDVDDVSGMTIRDAANNHCKKVISQNYYFVGRYDFKTSGSAGILLHRSTDGESYVVRATEYSIVTTMQEDPTLAEATIWETGETSRPRSTFLVNTANVCFKFMKNEDAYQRELQCRLDMGVSVDGEAAAGSIMPLKDHFNLLQETRRIDRRYKRDAEDDRFRELYFQEDGHGGSISLPQFPFALVFSLSERGDLSDFFMHHGVLGMDHIRMICGQVGRSLQAMHEKALVHTNVCMRNVVCLSSPDEGGSETRWALTDLSCACRSGSESHFVAEISANGLAQFSTGSLPPEMFVKLAPDEIHQYKSYWSKVEETHNVSVDREIIEPHIDPVSGDCFVLRCHYKQGSPVTGCSLPYKLVPARETMDVWAFGIILFSLCSSGHPLFPVNPRTGNIGSYHKIGKWSQEAAKTAIYQFVSDPLAQDLLLHMLGPYEERTSLNMETIMSHPFFAEPSNSPYMHSALKRIMEQRSQESAARKHQHEQKAANKVADKWLDQRSTAVHVYDLQLQLRIHVSPSAMMRTFFNATNDAPDVPYSLVVLPYKLVRSKKGKFAPGSKKDVERAERMGKHLLGLCKTCHFACCVEKALSSSRDHKKSPTGKWTVQEIAEAVALPSGEFSALEAEMMGMAAQNVEQFRENPMFIATKMIQKSIAELKGCFAESNKAFVYLVDEFNGVPVVGQHEDIFPIQVTNRIFSIVDRTLPFMFMSVLYSKGVAQSVNGLVKLIFEGAYPHIPPSWDSASTGLPHELNKDSMLHEAHVLRDAINDFCSTSQTSARTAGDLRQMERFFLEFDTKRTFAGLKRVTSGDSSIWTTDKGVHDLIELSKASTFSDVFRSVKAKEIQIKDQQDEIEALKKRVEDLEFRRSLNLTAVPDENGTPVSLME